MADKTLQFLECSARAIPEKDRRRGAPGRISGNLCAVHGEGCRTAGQPLPGLRQSVLRVEVPGAQLHPQLAGAARARASCSRRRSCRTVPTRCPRCAGASARRTGCARAPARSTTGSVRSRSARSRSTSPTRRSSAGWRPDMSEVVRHGRRVAIVGAGPAGLRLRRRTGAQRRDARRLRPLRAHRRTVDLRHPAVQAREGRGRKRREIIEGMGVEFRLGVEIGRDLPSSACSASSMPCSSAWALTAP